MHDLELSGTVSSVSGGPKRTPKEPTADEEGRHAPAGRVASA
jgi:hypothetical protein